MLRSATCELRSAKPSRAANKTTRGCRTIRHPRFHPTPPTTWTVADELEAEAQTSRERQVVRHVAVETEPGRILEVELANVILREQAHGHAFGERDVSAEADVPGPVRRVRLQNRRGIDVVLHRADSGLYER